ncbi:MAG: tetratricopeptide repeat protein, partial [Planctomycetota bacterium]
MSRLLRTLPWILLALGTLWAAPAPAGLPPQDDEELFREFRDETALMLRRGNWSEARFELEDLLSEEPDDWRTRAHLARVEVTAGEFEAARGHLDRVYRQAEAGSPELLLALEADLHLRAELARVEGLDALLERVEAAGFELAEQPRLAWPAAQALLQAGRREEAREQLATAAAAPRGDWRSLLASGRAARALGDLVGGSRLVVQAAEAAGSPEAEVMAELAAMYFEAEGEGQRRAARGQAPGPLFRDALERNPRSEEALLGLHALGKVNWRRQRTAASEYVATLLE